MNETEQISIIKSAHQKYVDWWLPIDVASGSLVAPMSCHRFCEALLIYPDAYWTKWLGDILPEDKTVIFKRYVLYLIIQHYNDMIDLNKD